MNPGVYCTTLLNQLCTIHCTCTHTMYTGIITYFVPCYTAGKNAEAIGEGCLVHGVYSIVPILGIYCHALIRGKIREQKNIEVCIHNIV